LLGFILASGTAITLAFAGKTLSIWYERHWNLKGGHSHFSISLLNKFLSPALALSGAHVCDNLFMRWKEVSGGIPLFLQLDTPEALEDEQGTKILSRTAGRIVVGETIVIRILTAVSVLFAPSLATTLLEVTNSGQLTYKVKTCTC